jgi:hypothetical protein
MGDKKLLDENYNPKRATPPQYPPYDKAPDEKTKTTTVSGHGQGGKGH